MADIPIGIREIKLRDQSDREVTADFCYRTSTFAIQTRHEIVRFQKAYPFNVIVGQDFGEQEIRRWTIAHSGLWDASWFLVDKIKERGG